MNGLSMHRQNIETESRTSSVTADHKQEVLSVNIVFTSAGKPAVHYTFRRNERKVLSVGRDATDDRSVFAAFGRGALVPPTVSKRHAQLTWVNNA
ncbi:hypothetical protein FRC07_005779, partial [Ceratobasidium sp. 392]